MVQKEISIKGLIALFNSDEITKEEITKDLESYEKADLVAYIIEQNNISDLEDEDEDNPDEF